MRRKGFTLIELTVVIAIIAVLAGILAPVVGSYLEQARATRATAETRTLADAIRLYHRDTGRYPIYSSTNDATADGDYLVGPGVIPTAVNTNTISLVTYLTTNVAGFSTTAKMTSAGYRGPYLGSLDPDPWGNSYAAMAAALHGTTDWAFVVSAGPDGGITTDLTQAKSAGPFSTIDDDIGSVIK
jgi:general secretion pathway protein G